MLKTFQSAVAISCLISQSVLFANAFISPSNPIWLERRAGSTSLDDDVILEQEAEQVEDTGVESPILECGESLRSQEGSYTYVSEGQRSDTGDFCTLYLLAPADHVIEMEFPFFNVNCADDSAVAILDGWELDGQIFPSIEDHPQPMSHRYLPFCGDGMPMGRISSKQNVVQVMFEVPTQGQGFMLKVKFKPNPKPCNMMLWQQQYENIALRNYGQRRNCTVMSLYPQRVQFQYVNVGEQSKRFVFSRRLELKSGLRTSCDNDLGEDSVRVYQGHGVGPMWRRMVLGFCGVRMNKKASRPISLRCHSSAVTLVSSGEFYNKVIFSFLPTDQDDITAC